MKQIPGRIFLAEQRGLLETSHFRRYCTFRFGAYTNEHHAPFGSLLAINEETLAGGQAVALPATTAACVLVLPLLGAVRVGTARAGATRVEVEEMWVATVLAGSTLHLLNPYEADLVSCLHVWVELAPDAVVASSQTLAFEAAHLTNQFLELLPSSAGALPCRASLGRFAGRTEAKYHLRQPGAGFFAFVLAGAFEIAGRLLHANDGLALWDTSTVEVEALSNEALLLVLEVAIPA